MKKTVGSAVFREEWKGKLMFQTMLADGSEETVLLWASNTAIWLLGTAVKIKINL